MHARAGVVAGLGAALLAVGMPAAGATSDVSGHCANAAAIAVPGAERQRVSCHVDLSASTLALTGHSDRSDWGTLHSKESVNPAAGAGIQVDGYFPDDSTTNATHGWFHDAQFVIRLPER